MGTTIEIKRPAACNAGQLREEITAAIGRDVDMRLVLGDPMRLRFADELSDDETTVVREIVAKHDGSARCAFDAQVAKRAEAAHAARCDERRATMQALREKRRAGEPYTDQDRDALLDCLAGV